MAKLHKHLIVHANMANPPVKSDERAVEQWLTDIVHSMGMEVLRDASAAYCEQVGNRGMTADVLITTSHMILHTWDECEEPFLEFDIYTCSELDPDMGIEALQRFGAYNISYKFIDRYNGLTDIENFGVVSEDECGCEHYCDADDEDDADEAEAQPLTGRTIGDALVEVVREYDFWIWLFVILALSRVW